MAVSNMIFRLELGKHTTPGVDRTQNEDNIGYYFPQQPEVLLLRGQMFMVADSNGNEGLGEFTSKMAIQTVIQEYYEEPWVGTVEEMLIKSIMKANRSIIDANLENRSSTRFSISLCCGVIHQENLYLAHIGTCCAFLLSNNLFEILTRSHSLEVEKNKRELDSEGKEKEKVLVRALGIDEEVKIDIINRKLQINDIIFLCTDGVYDMVDDREIQSIITTASPQQACELVVKQALANQTPDDATAIVIKVKSIKRVEADDTPSTAALETAEPADRQIVIKGVRYRSTWQEERLPAEAKEPVTEFSQDRDMRRPILKRKTSDRLKREYPMRQLVNILTILGFLVLVAFLVIKYVPDFLRSRTTPSAEDITRETLNQKSQPQPESDEQKDEAVMTPVPQPAEDDFEDTGEYLTEPEPSAASRSQLEVAIIDGSLKPNIRWNVFIDGMKQFSVADKINQVKSTLKIQKSKILWLRNGNSERENIIQQRVEQYQRFFAQNFQVSPDISPLDFTLVIGADFKQPKLSPISFSATPAQTDVAYYLEILNGFTTPGLARRLNEQLDRRMLDNTMLIVVDYRNADRKNYKVSFIKCDPSRNGEAARLGTLLGQRMSVVNTQLFDIKLIVGADIVF